MTSGHEFPGQDFSRRRFLARVGVLGALTGAGGWVLPRAAGAGPRQLPGGDLLDVVRPLLAELSRDTLDALTTFVVPGPDRYSRAQGTPRAEPGALEAEATDFLIDALDNFLPVPQDVTRSAAEALGSAVSGLGVELPASLTDLLPLPLPALDEAVARLVGEDEAVPLSLVVALLLNLAATQADPTAVSGPFVSPFARLSFADKARAFELLEGPDADLVGALDTRVPEPLRSSVSGLLRFVAGALLEFPAFGAYSEWAVFDPGDRRLRATPVGWELTGYAGVSDGWDDLVGYYQDRREVTEQ